MKWVDLERELPSLFAFARISGLQDEATTRCLETYLLDLSAADRLSRMRDRLEVFAGLARRITESLEGLPAKTEGARGGLVGSRYAVLPLDLRMALFLMIEADFNVLQTAEIVGVDARDLATRLERAITDLDRQAAA